MPEIFDRALVLIENSIAELLASLPSVAFALIVFYIFYRASKWARRLAKGVMERTNRTDNVQLIISRFAAWGVILLGFLFAVTIALPGFDASQLVSILGISSVAIGFAFNDILQNFLAGILILLTDPFKIGDQIVYENYEGTVEDIQIRATVVRTYDNRQIVIPNGELFTNSVTVNTAYKMRRSQYDVGIGYSDDIAAAQQLCLDVMREIDGVLDYPAPDTIMTEMGDSAVVFRVRWWTDPRQANVLRIQDQVLRTIKNRLTENGFDIPFPIRTVYMHQQEVA